MGSSTREDPKQQIPTVLVLWGKLLHTLPALNIGGLNFSITIAAAVFLACVRFAAEYLLTAVFGWPVDNALTAEAAGSAAAITHSTILVTGLYQCFKSHKYVPSEKLSVAPVWWQEGATSLIQLCTGYMIYDACVNILWPKRNLGLSSDDIMFLGHHVTTMLYMISTRVVGAGHQSAMMCMFLGELTNPLHNAYFIGEKAMQLSCCNGPTARSIFRVVELIFSAAYLAIRGPIAPAYFAPITWDLWARGRHHIPIWLITLWSVMIWAVLYFSIPWTVQCWNVLAAFAAELGIIKAEVDQEL